MTRTQIQVPGPKPAASTSKVSGEAEAVTPSAPASVTGNTASKKVRVLVVDDDHGQRTVLKTLLQKSGYQVDTAEDGVEAVRAAGRVAYDVVLMDGFMPNKTGWEATTQIRQEENARGDKKKLVIIGVTGATSKEDEEKCFASGMTDVISKPVKREALNAKIEWWTSSVPAADAASQPESPSAATPARSTASKKVVFISVTTVMTDRISWNMFHDHDHVHGHDQAQAHDHNHDSF